MGLGAQGSEETGRSFEGCREAAEAPPAPTGRRESGTPRRGLAGQGSSRLDSQRDRVPLRAQAGTRGPAVGFSAERRHVRIAKAVRTRARWPAGPAVIEGTPGGQHTWPAFLGEPTGAETDDVGEAAERPSSNLGSSHTSSLRTSPAACPQGSSVTLLRLGPLTCQRGTCYCHLPSCLWPVDTVRSMRSLVQSWPLRCICFMDAPFPAPFCFLLSP